MGAKGTVYLNVEILKLNQINKLTLKIKTGIRSVYRY